MKPERMQLCPSKRIQFESSAFRRGYYKALRGGYIEDDFNVNTQKRVDFIRGYQKGWEERNGPRKSARGAGKGAGSDTGSALLGDGSTVST